MSKSQGRRPISGLELVASGVLSAAIGRLVGKHVIGEEWVRRSERIDARADELAAKRKRKRKALETLPGLDEMLDSRHKSLEELSIPTSSDRAE